MFLIVFVNHSLPSKVSFCVFSCRAVPANPDEKLVGRFLNGSILPEEVRLYYLAAVDFSAFAKKFGVMDDFRVNFSLSCMFD